MTGPASLTLIDSERSIVPNLITVASGKGGVGKTWFASTLAHTLAFRGKRVLLFDGDLGLANIDVQLGLTPEHDLGSVIAGRIEFEDAVTPFQGGADSSNKEAERKTGFDVIAGRSGSGTLATLSRQELNNLTVRVAKIAASYDFVIIDLAAGIDQAAQTLSLPSGHVFVVLNDEPTSLTDAYAFIKVMSMRGAQNELKVIVNSAANKSDGRRTYAALANACQNFLGFEPPLAGIIRRDQKVRQAIRQQSAILVRYPQADAARDVAEIAQKAF